MLINKRSYGYSSKKKYVIGRGFMDSMSSIFNSVKSSVLPAFGSVGSYLKTNKDLIIKPLLGAVGQLGAKALTEGVPAIINRIRQNQQKKNNNMLLQTTQNTDFDPAILNDAKFKELLKAIEIPSSTNPPMSVSNILGRGFSKKTKKRGRGLKTF